MAEDRNQFHSIYGDQGDEFEIEDISDETLTIPTDEIRAAREEELAEEAAEEESEEQIADQIKFEESEETEDINEQEDPEEEDEESEESEEESEADLEEQPDEEDKVSILSYIGHAILFTIPVIGTVAMLVYIISENRNPHLRHLAQIWLVTLLLIAIGAVAAVTILGLG